MKRVSVSMRRAVAFDVDVGLGVHHDLGDGRVVEVHLHRPVAEDVVTDLERDRPALVVGERRRLRPHGTGELLTDESGQFVGRERRVVQAGTQLGEQRLLGPLFHPHQRVGGDGAGRLSLGGLVDRGRRGGSGRDDRCQIGPLQTIAELHDFLLKMPPRSFSTWWKRAVVAARLRPTRDLGACSTRTTPWFMASGTSLPTGT